MIGREDLQPQFEFQVRHHHEQIGVAGAFSVAIGGALVGVAPASTAAMVLATAQPVSSRQWIPRRPSTFAAHVADDARDPRGQHSAVGVTHHRRFGPGIECTHHRHRVVGIVLVPVEEVLAVDEDPSPAAIRCSTVSVTMAMFSPLVRSASRTWRMSDLATSVMTGAWDASRAATCASSATATPALRVAPNATRVALRNLSSEAAREELGVLGMAPGQPPSMK